MTNHVSTLNVLLYGEPIATITNVGNDRTLFAFMDSYIHDESRPVLGMGFVFTAVGIAPSHKQIVGISTSVFTLLLTGFLIYPMLRLSDYWALWGAFCLVTSVIVSTINVYRRHR